MRLAHLRELLAVEMGVVLPAVKVMDSREVPPRGYRVRQRGNVLGIWTICPDGFLALPRDPESRELDGDTTVDIDGRRGVWVERSRLVEAQEAGCELLPVGRSDLENRDAAFFQCLQQGVGAVSVTQESGDHRPA